MNKLWNKIESAGVSEWFSVHGAQDINSAATLTLQIGQTNKQNMLEKYKMIGKACFVYTCLMTVFLCFYKISRKGRMGLYCSSKIGEEVSSLQTGTKTTCRQYSVQLFLMHLSISTCSPGVGLLSYIFEDSFMLN